MGRGKPRLPRSLASPENLTQSVKFRVVKGSSEPLTMARRARTRNTQRAAECASTMSYPGAASTIRRH